MLDFMQTEITIYYGNNIANKIFNDIRSLNKCFNEINNLNCNKEVWLDETYISFKFKTEKSFFKALKVLESY